LKNWQRFVREIRFDCIARRQGLQ